MDYEAYMYIEDLCLNDDEFSESELIERLRSILDTRSHVLRERTQLGCTLLYAAVERERSVDFCKLLVDHNADLVRTPNHVGALPIHLACSVGNSEIIKFLLQQFPDSINIPDLEGWYPIHWYLQSGRVELELLQYMLKNDQGALSPAAYTPIHESGNLLLHIAIENCNADDLYIITEVFNAYPYAIHIKDNNDCSPLNIAHQRRDEEFQSLITDFDYIVDFLESQIEFDNEARQITTTDERGQLPIHRALRGDSASLGAIKLMVAANPASLNVADNNGLIPLHHACDDIEIVKFLVDANKASLSVCDSEGNFALHHASLWRNWDVVSFLLTQTTQGASVRNTDGKLPIEILFYNSGTSIFADEYRGSQEYTEAVYHLLRAYPDAMIELAH